jgi:hypothetical protein
MGTFLHMHTAGQVLLCVLPQLYQYRETRHMLINRMEPSKQKTMTKLTKLVNDGYEINQNLFLTSVAGCELRE